MLSSLKELVPPRTQQFYFQSNYSICARSGKEENMLLEPTTSAVSTSEKNSLVQNADWRLFTSTIIVSVKVHFPRKHGQRRSRYRGKIHPGQFPVHLFCAAGQYRCVCPHRRMQQFQTGDIYAEISLGLCRYALLRAYRCSKLFVTQKTLTHSGSRLSHTTWRASLMR